MTEHPADVVAELRTVQSTTSVANPNRTRLMDLLSWDELSEAV